MMKFVKSVLFLKKKNVRERVSPVLAYFVTRPA